LLVVRDLALGRRTYSEMAASPERIPTNILAERLKRLERGGIIKRVLYQEHPPRYAYALTQSGKELGSVLLSIVAWGKKYIPGTKTPMEIEADEKRKQENKNDAKFRKN
jgi:DNA-binding HxlR family transcriptional regulator